MKKGILIVLIFTVLIFGINKLIDGNRIVETDISKVNVSKLSGTLHNWVSEHKTAGVFIGRIPKTNKNEEYYVYSNDKKVEDLCIRNDRKSGIAIEWKVSKNEEGEKFFVKILTKNKRPDYIIFGGKKISILSIPIIKE